MTNRLGKLMGIQPGDWAVDLASGPGVSAAALSRAFHCRVVGIEFGAQAAAEARAAALDAPTPPDAFFLRGDAEHPPLSPSSVDRVVCECSMSIFPEKQRAVNQVLTMLRPSGTFGLSDVTVEPGSLPEELGGALGRVLCLAEALTVEGYAALLEQGGLVLTHREDASGEILRLLADLEGKLAALLAWQNIAGSGELDQGILQAAPGLITQLRELVSQGKLGYWLFVAQKPG